MSGIPDWEDPRRVLGRHGLAPKRGFSQNFLVSKSVVEEVARATVAGHQLPVVELGPGLGTLTTALLRAGAASVIAIERDRDMARVLRAELADCDAFELVEADAAQMDLEALASRKGEKLALAGNLPYAITGAILRRLVEERASIERAVVMIQREVRDRLLAEPGNKTYGALTVFTSAVYRIEPVLLVKPGSFHPPPKVSSAVVKLEPLDPPRAEETESFRAVVRASFESRRKTLRNALSKLDGGTLRSEAALEAAGIDPRRRGETLSVEEFAKLAECWEAAG